MTIRHNPFKGKFIAFHKGQILSDYILAWIIDAALRGMITPAGAKLILIPDTRHGSTDVSGLRTIGKKMGKDKKTGHMKIDRTKRSDCLTLKQLIRKNRQSKRLAKKQKNSSEI